MVKSPPSEVCFEEVQVPGFPKHIEQGWSQAELSMAAIPVLSLVLLQFFENCLLNDS